MNGILIKFRESNMAGWEISEQATEVYSWENHGTRWVERNSNVYIVTRGYEQAKCGFHEPKCGKTNMLWDPPYHFHY